jgi:hypothetical protein
MESVLAIPLAILHELELFGLGLAILGGGIIAPFALGARKSDYLDILLFGSHISDPFGEAKSAIAYNKLLA